MAKILFSTSSQIARFFKSYCTKLLSYEKRGLPPAFTIVELLVVIVVIGILATITIVSYTGISRRAIISSLQSDLSNALTQIKLYQVTNDAYPTTLDCSTGPNPTPPKICLKTSPGNTYASYLADNTIPQTFCLTAENGSIDYRITNDIGPTGGNCAALASGNALPSDLLLNKTATTDAGGIVGTMPNKVGSATVITPGTTDQVIPQGYYGGVLADGKVSGIINPSSGSQLWTVPGTYVWTVPVGVNRILVGMFGAGGGGATGGGGGGAYVCAWMTISSPTITIIVGAGGLGGSGGNDSGYGIAGGQSSVGSLVAGGGGRGTSYGQPTTSAIPPTGPDYLFGHKGGQTYTGGQGNPMYGGGAGGSGGDATGATGGIASANTSLGGAGGNGGANGSYYEYTSWGAGGGGGGYANGANGVNFGSGGKGGDGAVFIRW